MKSYLDIGQIVNTYGIKGFVKVVPYTDNIKRFDLLKTIYIEYKKELIKMEVEELNYGKNTVHIKFKEIKTMNDAETYRNCILKIDRAQALELPKDSYFIVDLIGLEVYTENNEYLGNIEDIFQTRK